jgi:hypothetical protein
MRVAKPMANLLITPSLVFYEPDIELGAVVAGSAYQKIVLEDTLPRSNPLQRVATRILSV